MEGIARILKDFLRRSFDIREGEHQRVLLMQLNIFLITFTLLIIKPVVTAQFLSVIGIEQLPFVFVLVAVAAMVVSTIYSRALNSNSLHRITISTLLISIVALIAIRYLLHWHIALEFVLYGFYIGVAIFGVLATSQFWIMANLAFDAREAKRLFGFIGAGPIAGGVAGGYATSVLTSIMESADLLYIAAGLLCLCIPLNSTIWRKHIEPLNTFRKKKRINGFVEHPVRIILKSKHLSYLASIIGLSVIVAKLVDYQFSSVAIAAISDPDQLTSFFGFWFSTFNVVSLLIQLFLTRKIVGTFGVGSSLFALPSGILLGSLLLVFAPVLWAGTFMKLWDVSVKQSVNKAATELLSLPIPASIKSQTKSFIDIFVDLLATGVGGILLILIVNILELSLNWVSLLTIVIVAIWFYVALKVRKEYLNSFKSKLAATDNRSKKTFQDLNNESVLNGLRRALNEGTDSQVIYVLNKVNEVPDKRMFEDVSRFLSNPDPRIRLAALNCIYSLKKSIDDSLLKALISDSDEEVRFRAFSQLLAQTKEDRLVIIASYLVSEDPMISGSALVGLAEESRNNPEMKRLLKLKERITEKSEYINLTSDSEERSIYIKMVLRSIGHSNMESLYHMIIKYLEDQDMTIRKEAIRAAGLTMNSFFLLPLAQRLSDKQTRSEVKKALEHFGPGVIPELTQLCSESGIRRESSYLIPSVIEQFESQLSVNALLELLDQPDANLRSESLRSLNTIQKRFPAIKVNKKTIIEHILEETLLFKNTLAALYQQTQLLPTQATDKLIEARQKLITLVEQRLDATLERIFRLLGLRYPPEDVIPVYQGIRHVNPTVRINSVEFLDNLLEPALKRTLIPIAESAAFENISNSTLAALRIKVPSEHECFGLLLQGKDPKLKMAVLQVIGESGDLAHLDLVRPYLTSAEPKLMEEAKKIISDLQG